MKILKTSLFVLALLGIVSCNQNTNNEAEEANNSGNISLNDSIMHSNNPPPSRDLGTVANQEPVLEETSLNITETPTQMKVILPNKDLFEEGKADFKTNGQVTLNEIYKVINGRGIGKVLITGNTGREGNPDVNLKLSTDRAMAIAKWLKSKDLKSGITLSSQGAGDRFPMISYEFTDGSPNPQANDLNNRTEITFRKSKLQDNN